MSRPTTRRGNGNGTVYRRANGSYEAAAYTTTPDGRRTRTRVITATKRDAQRELRKMLAREDAGISTPDVVWRVDEYLEQWLRTTAQLRCRPKTIELYTRIVYHYLIPRLGKLKLKHLGVRVVQAAFDRAAAEGVSVRLVCEMRKVLSAALTQAQREELIVTNPARLTRVAAYRPQEVIPWTPRQIAEFLYAAESDRLYPAFVLLVLYGLRRGEVVGLRWEDVDYERGVIRIRRQLQSVGGQLTVSPVKTRAGERDLPLLPLAKRMLSEMAPAAGLDGFVVRTAAGAPLPPHSLGDAFQRIRKRAGLPNNRLHDLRHATATMLKSLRVPVRDAQNILGHASPLTTQTIYQHTAEPERRAALEGVEKIVLDLTVTRSHLRSHLLKIRQALFGGLQGSDGGPGGDRTRDTLLKRASDSREDLDLPLLVELVHDRARRQLVGSAATRAAIEITACRQSANDTARRWLMLTKTIPEH